MSCTDKMYLTGNPICSNNPRDLSDNARVFDAYVNSAEFSVTDRFGVERVTLAWVKWRIDTAIDEATGEIRAEWQTGVANINSEETAALNNINTTTAASLDGINTLVSTATSDISTLRDSSLASIESAATTSLTSIEEAKDNAIEEIIETGGVDIVQEPGQDTNKVMSQKAVTDFVSESTPIGTVQAYISENAPNDKWLLCRGQAFSAESYPDLAQLLPDLKIPDLRGVALRGLDANRGFDPDRALLSYQEDAMQKIIGNIGFKGGPSYALVYSTSGAFSAYEDGTQSGYMSSNTSCKAGVVQFNNGLVGRVSNETVMKNVAVNFIIKAR